MLNRNLTCYPPSSKMLWELVCCLRRNHRKVRCSVCILNDCCVSVILEGFSFFLPFTYCPFWNMSAGKADSDPELKYMCHTVKKLMMQRIFLTEKKEGETSTGEPKMVQNRLWSLSSNAVNITFYTMLPFRSFFNIMQLHRESECLFSLSQEEVVIVVNRWTQPVCPLKKKTPTNRERQKKK